jgi:hypothetical protein
MEEKKKEMAERPLLACWLLVICLLNGQRGRWKITNGWVLDAKANKMEMHPKSGNENKVIYSIETRMNLAVLKITEVFVNLKSVEN